METYYKLYQIITHKDPTQPDIENAHQLALKLGEIMNESFPYETWPNYLYYLIWEVAKILPDPHQRPSLHSTERLEAIIFLLKRFGTSNGGITHKPYLEIFNQQTIISNAQIQQAGKTFNETYSIGQHTCSACGLKGHHKGSRSCPKTAQSDQQPLVQVMEEEEEEEETEVVEEEEDEETNANGCATFSVWDVQIGVDSLQRATWKQEILLKVFKDGRILLEVNKLGRKCKLSFKPHEETLFWHQEKNLGGIQLEFKGRGEISIEGVPKYCQQDGKVTAGRFIKEKSEYPRNTSVRVRIPQFVKGKAQWNKLTCNKNINLIEKKQ